MRRPTGRLNAVIAVIATTPTAGQNFVGLYNAAGTRLATTNVDAVTTTTAGLRTTAITPVALVPGFYWVAFVFNAAVGPTIARATAAPGGGGVVNVGLATAALRAATNATAQTSLPATINPASNLANFAAFWAALG